MATRWRIRHKLLVGLALVCGAIALLLFGTLQGLGAYIATLKTADSKLAELDLAEEFKRTVTALADPSEPVPTLNDEEDRLRGRLTKARADLAAYETRLQDTVQRRHDPDGGEHERLLVGDLKTTLDAYQSALDAAKRPRALTEGDSRKLGDNPALQATGQLLIARAHELRQTIYHDVYQRIAEAKTQHRRSVAIVIGSSGIAVIVVAALVALFVRWVVRPVALLQAGVARVAAGDFEGQIVIPSGDEMEELGHAFTNMTGRLRDLYADLNRQVSDRSSQLARSEQLASVGFLAAGVAHEINNPLASIAFCSEALERRIADPTARTQRDAEAITKYLKMIQQEAFRCKTITQNLLEFSRVGEGERQPTDLVEVVQGVLEMAQHLRSCQGKRVVFRPTARLNALANPQELKQVVLNMVVNALDSMDDGGTLTILLAPNATGEAELTFADSGCGMAADVLPHIFEPFFTRSRTGKGTGLGLSISQRIVTGHGGHIEASSPGPTHGSTFVVRLPLAARTTSETSTHAAAAA